jgi:hypothetical protein
MDVKTSTLRHWLYPSSCSAQVGQSGMSSACFYGVPHVLRPTEDGFYYVIRECYIDGFMHGKTLSDESLRATQFRL